MRMTTAMVALALLAAPVMAGSSLAAEEPRGLPVGANPSATRADESKGPEKAGPGRRTLDHTGRPEPTEPLVHDRQKPSNAPAVAR